MAENPMRASFASQGAKAAEYSTGARGSSGSANIVGGNTQGGVVMPGTQSDASYGMESLGAFVEKALAPQIEAKKKQRFFEGFTAAQSGIALKELTSNGSPITKIFGPSSFEQGAQFYTAKKAIDQWVVDRTDEMDTLKKLDEKDLARVLAEKSQSMLTGDPFADAIIQQGLMEQTSPMMNAIAKKRYEWKQNVALQAQSESWYTGSTALQKMIQQHATVGNPTEDSKGAVALSVQNFAQLMQQPPGMDDETYKKGLYNFMLRAMEDGHGYSVEVMKQSGIMDIFTDDQKVRLEDRYERYADRATSNASRQFFEDILSIDAAVKQGSVSANEAVIEYAKINEKVRQLTGFDHDLFDEKDLRSAAGNVVEAAIAAYRRAEDRKWQLEDMSTKRRWDLEDKATEEAEEASAINLAWGVGGVRTAVANGAKAGLFDAKAIDEVRQGEFGGVVRAFNNESWVSQDAAKVLQAGVTGSMGAGYTKGFGESHKRWQQLNQMNPAAAKAYYGDLHEPMMNYNRLVRGGSAPNDAYVAAFGNPGSYSTKTVPPEKRKEVRSAIDAEINKRTPWFFERWFSGRANPNKSSKEVIANAIENEVAIASANSDLPSGALVKKYSQVALSNGSLEWYDKFAWRNDPGTTPVHQIMRRSVEETSMILTDTVDKRLKAAGYKEGASGDNYEIRRVKAPGGKMALVVTGFDADSPQTIVIDQDQLVKAATDRRNKDVKGNRAPFGDGSAAKLDPYRRIKGESGWERTQRINREVKDGAYPVKK